MNQCKYSLSHVDTFNLKLFILLKQFLLLFPFFLLQRFNLSLLVFFVLLIQSLIKAATHYVALRYLRLLLNKGRYVFIDEQHIQRIWGEFWSKWCSVFQSLLRFLQKRYSLAFCWISGSLYALHHLQLIDCVHPQIIPSFRAMSELIRLSNARSLYALTVDAILILLMPLNAIILKSLFFLYWL